MQQTKYKITIAIVYKLDKNSKVMYTGITILNQGSIPVEIAADQNFKIT